MKIAQLAPVLERVPPFRYGGIELVVSLLTEELVRRGHEVTLFASGDSITKATLKSAHNQATRLDKTVQFPVVYEYIALGDLYSEAHKYDIIHSHMGFQSLPFASLVKTPTVQTLHGTLDFADFIKIYRYYGDQPYISISDAQREPLPDINYVSTVYNGIDTNAYPFQAESQQTPYLLFLGRMPPEKGPEQAIAIAHATGIPLKMAGKVDSECQEYFEATIKPLIDGEHIQYLGEVSHEEKAQLLGGAVATLFPIQWREPFGLVMIESMATGTPVIGMGYGSVPEVIDHGKTGFVCHSLEEMIEAVPEAIKLNRQTCRDYVEKHFSVSTMVDEYLKTYEMVIERKANKSLSMFPWFSNRKDQAV